MAPESSDWVDITRRRLAVPSSGPGLHSGVDNGAGGTNPPDMETRVIELEKAVTAIRIDLAEIKGKLSHMPTTWSLVIIIVGLIFTVMGGTLGIVKMMHP